MRRGSLGIFWAGLALAACMVASSTRAATVLLVTAESGSLTSNESAYKSHLESQGYTVTTVWDNASQGTIDAAWAAADVVYVPFSVTDWELGDKLRLCTKGVVCEERYIDDNLGMSTQAGWDTSSYTSISITNNSHYITSPFSTGSLTIFTSSQPMALMNPTHAAGLTTLAEQHFGNKALAVVDVGGTLANTVSGNSTAAGRRVHLPWGGDSFNISSLNSNAQTIGLRAIEWAIGNTLMLHYRLDASSGTTLTDSSGNNRHGAFNAGTPTWTVGRRRNALQFNGSNDADTDANFDPPGTGSVAFWFKGNGTPSVLQRLMGITTNWEITLKTDGKLGFDLGAGAGFSSNFVFSSVGKWHHVVAIYNSTADTYSVYVDGVLDASGTLALSDQPAGILSVGARTGTTDRFVGVMDDLRIYSEELTASKVAEIYGLIGHWKLNNTSGTTATDSSLKSLNGAYTNGPVVGQAGPYPGHGQYAAAFDGSNDYVNAGASTNHQDFYDGFSVAGWVNLDAYTNNAAILENGSTTETVVLAINGTGQVRVSGRSSGGLQSATSATALTTGKWKHVVGTYDGSTLRVYIDGQLDATASNTFTITTASGDVSLGASLQGTDEFLDGRLHDVRFYNRAIAADEVAELHGLIGRWELDETSGTVANDTSPTDNDGVFTNSPSLAQAGPYPGAGQYATQFDGVNDHVVVGSVNADLSSGFTVSAWARPTGSSNWQRFLDFGNGSGVDNIFFGRHSSATNLTLIIHDGSLGSGTLIASGALEQNVWHHYVGTCDNSGNATIYRDGQVVATGVTGTPSNVARTINYIARSNWAADPYYQGSLHDVRLYNRPLSTAQVAELYGLTGHWRFDEGSGSTIADSSGSGANAAFNTGTPAWTSGAYSNALSFSGSNDADTNSAFYPPSVGAVAFWMRPNGTPAARQRPLGLSTNWEVRHETTGQLWFDISGDGGNGGFQTVAALSDAKWRHITAMYDSSDNSYAVYVDGVLDKSGTSTIDLTQQSAAILTFGRTTGTSDFYAGALDDIRIYSRKLSPWEVYQIYGLMAWYKMDETSGTAAVDSTGRGQDGVYSGSPTLNVSANGATSQGTAVAFNGANYMQATGLYDKSSNVSAAAWVRLDGVDSLGGEVVSIGDCFLLRLNSGSNGAEAKYYNGSTWITATASRFVINTGWHHFAAVLDGGSTLKLYIDGVEAASTAASGAISYTGQGANTRIASHANGFTNVDLVGRVDDARIFNRALKPEEVFQLYRGSRIDGIRILQWVETR